VPTPRQRTFRVGLTVAVAVALAMAGTFLIGREQRFWERKQAYEIRFTRINGLRIGAPVSLAGVDIGSVQSVSFPKDPRVNYVAVSVSISGRAASRIREDSLARIRTIGLLGDKFVEIAGGSPQSPMLPPGSIIPSADPIDYEALLGESGDIITNIVETTNSLKNVLAAVEHGEGLLGQLVKNREQGTTTLGDLQRTVAHVEATTASLERMVKNVESGKGAFGVLLTRGEETRRLLTNLNQAASELERLTTQLASAQGALPQLIRDKDYGQALLRDLRDAAANLAEFSEKINHGNGTVGELVNDPSLYHEAKGLLSSTRGSWAFSLYQGIRGLFPPYGSSGSLAPPADPPSASVPPNGAAPLPTATATP
jgi:phospholipid/cholesterol/gamma-HCH transport system substrate-binding protein